VLTDVHNEEQCEVVVLDEGVVAKGVDGFDRKVEVPRVEDDAAAQGPVAVGTELVFAFVDEQCGVKADRRTRLQRRSRACFSFLSQSAWRILNVWRLQASTGDADFCVLVAIRSSTGRNRAQWTLGLVVCRSGSISCHCGNDLQSRTHSLERAGPLLTDFHRAL